MISFPIDTNVFKLNCAFYEKCNLPKEESLWNNFPNFIICTEYQAKKDNLGL